MTKINLVPADRSEPLRRVMADRSRHAIYLGRPDLVASGRAGTSSPADAPNEDLIAFDEALNSPLLGCGCIRERRSMPHETRTWTTGWLLITQFGFSDQAGGTHYL